NHREVAVMDELKLIFASNLIRLRTAAGMTQAELGEQLNYSDKSISKWERGEAIPDAAVLKRMSEIFGVTVDYLLDEHDAWQPAPDPADVRDRSHASIIQVALTGIVTLAVLVFVVLWLWLGKVEWVVFPCFVPAALITYLVLNSVFLTDGETFMSCSALWRACSPWATSCCCASG
ncbi:membrane protein containing Helix-turn-helix type 3 domain protein, partial [human gut metagenome]